jgi:hypothetical protein
MTTCIKLWQKRRKKKKMKNRTTKRRHNPHQQQTKRLEIHHPTSHQIKPGSATLTVHTRKEPSMKKAKRVGEWYSSKMEAYLDPQKTMEKKSKG